MSFVCVLRIRISLSLLKLFRDLEMMVDVNHLILFGSGQVNDLTLGCQNSDSASSSKAHHLALLALLVALVLH